MRVYCINHGIAMGDELLLPGESQAARAGWIVRGLQLRREETLFLTSPARRTINTAAIVGETADIGPAKVVEWLGEKVRFAEFAGSLKPLMQQEGLKQVVLVGHMPLFEDFLAAFEAKDKKDKEVNPGDVLEIDMDTDTIRKLSEKGGEV